MARATDSISTIFGAWGRAATLASAVAAFGLVMAWPPEGMSSANAPDAAPVAQPCGHGDDVSRFVCRNTWMATLRGNYR
jgi:hypothetical protein